MLCCSSKCGKHPNKVKSQMEKCTRIKQLPFTNDQIGVPLLEWVGVLYPYLCVLVTHGNNADI